MSLQEDGYLLYRGILDKSEIDTAMACYKGTLVNYGMMERFINIILMRKTSEKLSLGNINYVKYRVSNNNNSSDASTFHRDIICGNKNVNMYTCLTYLDKTVMEVIPGSHLVPQDSYLNAFDVYAKRKQVTIGPGDVLLLNSNLLHRGIFTENLPNRRLIQVFEVFFDEDELHKNFIHVLGNEKYSDTMISLSKNSFFVGLLNWFGYLNALTGYGNPNQCFSSEGLRGRIVVSQGTWQEINKYVVVQPTIDLPTLDFRKFHYLAYDRQFFIYAAILGIILASLGLAVLYVAIITWRKIF
jgi:hypothetical protein